METNTASSFETINPYTQQALEHYEVMPWQTVEQRIEKAAKAFAEWKNCSFDDRAALFNRLAEQLEAKKDEYAKVITTEMGKPLSQAKAEVKKCAWVCRYYAQHAEAFLEDNYIEADHKHSFVAYQPLGAILQIMPWNFPFWQVFRFAAPALMAGNVTLLKHAPNVLGCAKQIEDLFAEVGFPEGVFQQAIVPVEMVERIMACPQIKGVALTGSLRAGSAVGALAGKHIKPCVLELGGSDAFIVLTDANLKQAAKEAVRSRMHNSGQTCISAKRFIVEEAVAEQFKKLVLDEIAQLKVGDPTEADTNIGTMARPDLVETLHKQVQQSVAMGAVLELEGGHKEGTNYYYPQVLSNIQEGMPAYEEELFGPVVSFFEVADANEAVRLANDTIFGLGASVWSEDRKRAEQIALKLEVGAVAINQLLRSDPRIPFGGTKQSGIGRELGKLGIFEFVNVKSITVD